MVNRREKVALTRKDTDGDEHLAVLADARATTQALRRMERKMNALLTRRRELFVEGRKLDPPLTFSRMADACSITEGAVMQVVVKAGKVDQPV